MRPGLVIIGAVIAVVGAALLVTVVLSPPMHPSSGTSAHSFTATAVPEQSDARVGVIHGEPSGLIVLVWTANTTVTLSFFNLTGCGTFVESNATCPAESPMQTWANNQSGVFTSASSIPCPCYVIPTDHHNYSVVVNGYMVANYPTTVPSLSDLSYVAVVFGSLILLIVGGLALFLGLFLRGRLFGTTPPGGPGLQGPYDDAPDELDPGGEYGDEGLTDPRKGFPPGAAG